MKEENTPKHKISYFNLNGGSDLLRLSKFSLIPDLN